MFELGDKPSSFVVHVSAETLPLFVNGDQVSSGPQRSDLMHWRYETVDLAPHLRPGRNVLAALVWNWGAERPVAQFSRQTAFLLQGNSPREAVVNSGPEWKVLRNEAYAPIPVRGTPLEGTTRLRRRASTRDGTRGLAQLDFSSRLGRAAAGEVSAPDVRSSASNPFGEAGLAARAALDSSMEESPVGSRPCAGLKASRPWRLHPGGERLVVPAKPGPSVAD